MAHRELRAADVTGVKTFDEFISSGSQGDSMRDSGTKYEVVQSDENGRTVRTSSPAGTYDQHFDNKGHATN